ncbi:MAG: CDP-alcohol phosphatidyltransferase family protein [Myxococcales bacterium]|nr:CDP-alcohol phosphatidyltransferase family protein [Myxococcales bacterium]
MAESTPRAPERFYFKLKDAVTAGNALCGVGAVVAVIEARGAAGPAADSLLYWACLLICLSWVFDALDGVVARLTNTFNKFGGEFDNMCDHLTYGIAPGFIVYAFYRDWMPGEGVVPMLLAFALAAWLPLTASIRGARLASKPIKVQGFWIGLPRPVSAFVAVCWFQTSTFVLAPDVGHWIGMALVIGLGVSNLGAFPFLSHHGHVWKPWVSTVLRLVPISLGILGVFGPIGRLVGFELLPKEWFFDLFWFLLFGYSLIQWFGIPADQWQKVRQAVRDWRDSPEPV